MSDVVSTLVVLAAVLGTFGLLERRLDRLEATISDIRGDIIRHLEWHIENQ